VTYIRTQRALAGVLLPGRQATGEGMVNLVHLMRFELLAQSAVDIRLSGKDEDSTGPFIQAMDDPDPAKLVTEQIGGILWRG